MYAGRCPGMPARCGRASCERGTSDRQDAHSQGAEQWTTGVEVRMMLPSNRRGGNALDHRLCPGSRAVTETSMLFRLTARCSILHSFKNVFLLSPASNLF